MQAIILAAGMGRRLGEFTAHNTKCMLPVNGIRLIDRMLRQLGNLNLTRIIVVIGYEGENLKNYILGKYPDVNIEFVENKVYDKTNNIYSLWLAKDQLAEDDTLLLESDLIFEDDVLKTAVESEYPNCALISKYETWMDGTMVRIDDDNNIINFIPKKAFKYADTDSYYKTVNIYKFSKDFINHNYIPFLDAYIKVLGENEYYEQVLRVLTLIDNTGLKGLPITGLHWYEIDDVQDLRIAETIFASPELQLKKLQQSYGGYWRYPGLLDYCYLVNPYFPRQRLIDEMKANFEPLLRDYPSGMGVNSLLAAKYFSLKQEYTVVGNGEEELIKSLMTLIDGTIGIVYPTIEEFPNRLDEKRIVKFFSDNTDFRYTAQDLIAHYTERPIDNLLLVNPDNPSGNLIDRYGIAKLTQWTLENGIRLIIDESFVDFSEPTRIGTLIRNDFLEKNHHVCVMKSISKSYGVPGLRLGVLASSDTELIKTIRTNLGIWNINSFAEFYMQIFGKYEKDYALACKKIREVRDAFETALNTIQFLRVIPSQANYLLCEVTNGLTAYDLSLILLSKYNILIEDCTKKKGFVEKGQFIRIAIRDDKDNRHLLNALKEIQYTLN